MKLKFLIAPMNILSSSRPQSSNSLEDPKGKANTVDHTRLKAKGWLLHQRMPRRRENWFSKLYENHRDQSYIPS